MGDTRVFAIYPFNFVRTRTHGSEILSPAPLPISTGLKLAAESVCNATVTPIFRTFDRPKRLKYSAKVHRISHSPAVAPLGKGTLLEFHLPGFGAEWRARNRR